MGNIQMNVYYFYTLWPISIANKKPDNRESTHQPAGSIETGHALPVARVAELVDATDLKSVEGNLLPVQFRLRAPLFSMLSANTPAPGPYWFLL
jgi:hypothetical protein